MSERAKSKISEKYSNRKLVFLTSDWLVDAVDKYYPYYWHQLPTATGIYLAELSRHIAELDAQTMLLDMPISMNTYIELDVELVDSDRYKKKSGPDRTRIVNFREELLTNKISLLEADMGFGKSKLARRMVSQLASPDALKKTNVLPIFLPFVTFVEKDYDSLDQRIESLLGPVVFAEANANGTKFLLVLDGIDEASGNAERCKVMVSKLVRDVRQTDIHVLLTSRPFKLLEEVPDIGQTANRYRIRPLSTKKIILFITEFCKQANLPKKLYQDLAKSDLFKQLPQNPIAAALLSNLLSQTKQDLPSNLTELYAKAMEFMLGRWDEKRALSTEKLYRACERISRLLARYMIENKLVYLSINEANQLVKEFLDDRNIGVGKEEVTNYLFNRSRVFGVLDETKTIFFRHRSFAEYLYARDAYERRDLKVDDNAFHPYWINVYFFYLGLLSECQDQIKELVELPPSDERSRWIKAIQLANYLLAGYQSTYSIIEDKLQDVMIELAELYLDVKNGRLQSHLNALSEMQFLWMFSCLIKHNLGYQFFAKALPLTMAQIDERANIDEETRVYALFFCACALGELDENCGYSFLLGKHATEKLPLPVSLAVKCEVEYKGKDFANESVIKLHEKKLRKLLKPTAKDDLYFQNRLTALFERPLKTSLNVVSSENRKAQK